MIENNTQGAGIVAEQAVNKAAPDGHAMVMLTAGYPGRAALHQGLAFDPLEGILVHLERLRLSLCLFSGSEFADQVVSRICSIAPRPSPTR